MTDEMIARLMAAGLTKQQASSVTAETLVSLFMPNDGKMLMREAQLRVAEMQKTVDALRRDYEELKSRINGISNAILAIQTAQEQYGDITDEKAKNVLALYAALLTMNEKHGVSATVSAESAGYIMYAYLDGQARRDYAKWTEKERGQANQRPTF